MRGGEPRLRVRGAATRLSVPWAVVAAITAALMLPFALASCASSDPIADCLALPDAPTLEQCETWEAHRRFNRLNWGGSLVIRAPVQIVHTNNVHGIDSELYITYALFRLETGLDLDFFALQDFAIQTHEKWSRFDESLLYNSGEHPELEALVEWAVRAGPSLFDRQWELRDSLTEIYLDYRSSRPSEPGEVRADSGVTVCGVHLNNLIRDYRRDGFAWHPLRNLSPEAIDALVRAYADPDYVLDMRGLLYRGDAWADLDEIYHNSLREAGIDPGSLPLIGDGLTRYADGQCGSWLENELRRVRNGGESSIDICEWQMSERGMRAVDREQLLHPACSAPGEESGDDS